MRKFSLLIVAFSILLAVLPYQVRAQDEISAYSTVDIEFPTAITFNLRAESAADITRIILRYRVDRIGTVKVTSLIQLRFDEAPSVETSWKWDMRKSGGLPPGTGVQYSWEIEDASGGEFETDWAAVQFDDDRYSWDSVADGNVTLFWYRGGQAFARELMDAARTALDKLARDTGAHLEHPVDTYIYASSSDLREAMVYPQEWMGGVAFTEYGIVAIGVAPEDLAWGKRTMAHELAHLVTYQMTVNPYADIPTWLTEGLSMYAEGDLEPSFETSLDQAVSQDSLISVQTLSSNFPTRLDEAFLSYAASYSLVEFLVDNYDKERMLQLLRTFKEGSSYDNALEKVYGFDTAGLDALWRKSLGLEPRPVVPTPPPEGIASPSPTPGADFFGCQAVSGETKHSGVAVFAAVGLLVIPGISEVVRLRTRRGKR